MEVVTGDKYLELLVKFVEKEAGSLIDGLTVLKLNPAGLHYVHSRLEALQEVESLLVRAPVDYLRAYVSDLGDHRALEQLRRILRLLTSLKVVSVLPHPTRDPTPLSLLPFVRLRVLELRCCDLSTSSARGLIELRHTLEKIICYDSTDALRHVFASRSAEIDDSPQWRRLVYASFACNQLVMMDESLQLLPAIETLDLSRNRFSKIDNLRRCTKLKNLDIGFNHLRSISRLNEVPCNLVRLVVRNNALSSLNGLQQLKSLEGLDVSYNVISNYSELEFISALPNLDNLWLEGNPLSCARWYRAHVYSYFFHPGTMKLDGKEISTRELWKRQVFIASRYKHRSSFGFYLPAKDNAEMKDAIVQKKRKVSRLAYIGSDDDSIATDSEKNSVSVEHDKDIKEVYISSESEIVDMMYKIEIMKKERSLTEVGKWMDESQSTNENDPFNMRLIGIFEHTTNDSPTADEANNSGKRPFDYFTTLYSLDQHAAEPNFPKSGTCDNGNEKHLAADREKATYFSINGPPPHYEDDVLHRRHNLFNENLQVLAGTSAIYSSDSDTTSSDDEEDIYEVDWPQNWEVAIDPDIDRMNKKAAIRSVSPAKHRIWNNENDQSVSFQIDKESPASRDASLSLPGAASQPEKVSMPNDFVESYFKAHVCNPDTGETLVSYVRCGCILDPRSLQNEREVALISSSRNRLYTVLINLSFDGSGNLSLLEGHEFEDLREILVGFGLQTIRILFAKGATYLFRTGSIHKSTELLSVLQVVTPSPLVRARPFISLEQSQADLFRREICGGSRTSIFQYSLVHFSGNRFDENSWRRRSLFLAGGEILVCAEDLTRFTSSMDAAASSSSSSRYFTLDSCCSVGGVSELLVDSASLCAIVYVKASAAKCCAAPGGGDGKGVRSCECAEGGRLLWKLRWYSLDNLRNFIALVKAIHADVSEESLAVRRISC